MDPLATSPCRSATPLRGQPDSLGSEFRAGTRAGGCRVLVERRQRVAEEAAAPARLSWTIVQCGHAAVAPVRRSASGGLSLRVAVRRGAAVGFGGPVV